MERRATEAAPAAHEHLSMPTPSDLEWIRGAVERHEAPLLRFAAALIGPGQAADVVQDTFLRLVAARREDVEGHLLGWLFTVCKNRALELKRSPARKAIALEEGDEMMSTEPTAAEVLEQRDDRTRVTRMIDELPERHREVVALRFAGGLSYREIAGVTGLTETNVGFILHTALKTLKKKLSEGEEGSERRAR
jgi:RNA polymerase sigma factor (sigma-70 family)